MKVSKLWLIGPATMLVLGGGGYGVYKLGQHHPATTTPITRPATTAKKPTPKATTPKAATPAPTKASIKDSDSAGLFNASYTKKLTDFTPWTESPVNVDYRDFNDDGVIDAFVWAQLPGTGHYSYAAVWTIGSDNKPAELWHLADELVLQHSTWSVTSNNGLENKSLNPDGTTNTVNTFHWQVSTTGAGFVLEPGSM